MIVHQQINGLMRAGEVAEIAQGRLQGHATAGQHQRLAELQRGDRQVVVARLAEIDNV